MKATFNKLILLTTISGKQALIHALQKLEVVHLENFNQSESNELERLNERKNKLVQLIETLSSLEQATAPANTKKDLNGIIKEIDDLMSNIEQEKQKIESDQKELERLSSWGNFTCEKFQPLLDKGYGVYLASATKKAFATIDLTDLFYRVVNEDQRDVYFLIISKEKELSVSFEYFALPERTPDKLRDFIKRRQEELEQLEAKLAGYCVYLPELKKLESETEIKIELTKGEETFNALSDGKMAYLSGWFPIAKMEEIRSFLDTQKVAFRIRSPYPKEDVPVLLKNSAYSKLYEPITNIFELPNYYETDLTPFIAVFYPILFAYCLGDAGYGFVLTVAMIGGFFTFLKSNRKMAILGIILGSVTTLMGFVKSGSLFGIMLSPDHNAPWVRYLSQFVFIPDDSDFVFNAFNVALMIGVVQILSGIIISIYTRFKYEGGVYALKPIGKLCIVISLIWIFMADMQNVSWLLGFETLRYGLLTAGILLVIFFHDVDISIGNRIASAFMPLFFITTGLLGDVLSYVRLFALGLASSVLGLVVNQIGQQIMDGGIIAIIMGIVFLLFGHTLNFGIAALGSFVHPLRLTFVEFYGNASFMGKGLPYQPFGKTTNQINN